MALPKQAPFTCSHMSIQGGPDIYIGDHRITSAKIHAPVHEKMTLAALVNSAYALDPKFSLEYLRDHPTQYSDVKDFVRGVLWNDDPACELFNESADNNLEYSTAVNWARIFMESKLGVLPLAGANLIGRSHFGDLQWLHGMGSIVGEEPSETKRKMMVWLECMYNVAVSAAGYSKNTRISDTGLRSFFDDKEHYETLGELFTRKSGGVADVKHRALGSCFHVIQDSYAVGHTRRERDGAGRLGSIINFHTYKGQDSAKHDQYDHSDGVGMPSNLKDLEAWNAMEGCRDGVERCIALANCWMRRADWKAEVESWLDAVVFKLSADVSGSDTSV